METTLSMPVKLVVKVPNQKVEDKTVDCELDWTVEKLKSHLSDVYSCKPKAEDQRLIYSGRLLHDHLRLKDVLRQVSNHDVEDQTHTVHLVCSTIKEADMSDSSEETREKACENSNSAENIISSSSHTNISNQSDSLSSAASTETLHHRSTTHLNANSFPSYQYLEQLLHLSPSVPGVPINPEHMMEQMVAIQQMYAQYIAQYMQHAQAGTNNNPQPRTSATAGSASQAGADINIANENQRVQPQPANNNNVRMNAQGGPVLDDEEEGVMNRDWLDYFYVICRSLVLFSIVYFYSSFGRFLVVMGISLLMYLYHGGFFARRVQTPARENQVAGNQEEDNERNYLAGEQHQNPFSPAPEEHPRGYPQDQDAEEIRQLEAIMDAENDPRQAERWPVVTPQPSLLVSLWSFISSFFLSLIPEQPPPVNIN